MSAVLKDPGLWLRPMDPSDLDAVLAVERAAYRYPWTEGIFRDCLRVGYCCWVAMSRGAIIGYGVMSIGAGECHILNLCVHPECQGQGLGRRILRRLLAIARAHGADTALLEVRVSNRRAIGLYEAEGFGEVGLRRAYYPADGGSEDAIVMARAI